MLELEVGDLWPYERDAETLAAAGLVEQSSQWCQWGCYVSEGDVLLGIGSKPLKGPGRESYGWAARPGYEQQVQDALRESFW